MTRFNLDFIIQHNNTVCLHCCGGGSICQIPVSRSTDSNVVLALIQSAKVALHSWLTCTELRAAAAQFKASSEKSV